MIASYSQFDFTENELHLSTIGAQTVSLIFYLCVTPSPSSPKIWERQMIAYILVN